MTIQKPKKDRCKTCTTLENKVSLKENAKKNDETKTY